MALYTSDHNTQACHFEMERYIFAEMLKKKVIVIINIDTAHRKIIKNYRINTSSCKMPAAKRRLSQLNREKLKIAKSCISMDSFIQRTCENGYVHIR